MRIVLITSVYPSKDATLGTTSVVHFFAKEWMNMGHDVFVIHAKTVFPRGYYLVGKLFGRHIASRLGYSIASKCPSEHIEAFDSVNVKRVLLRKYLPHSNFSQSQIKKALKRIIPSVRDFGVPDCFVGHWSNPQLVLLDSLKKVFRRPTCLVFHDNDFNYLPRLFGNRYKDLLGNMDLIGFRNFTAERNYETLYGKPERSFIAASGVPSSFISAGKCHSKSFESVSNFIFVGGLLKRKFPCETIEALSKAFGKEPFTITIIGDGEEKDKIESLYSNQDSSFKVVLTGRIPREEIIELLKNAEVFVMISRNEVFGLVYLEAMALGCIPVASKNEGLDGIIVDGENGFLCESGNVDELSCVINRIRGLSKDHLQTIAAAAKRTALEYSDTAVAERYIDELRRICRR